jgi:cytochrome b
MTAQANTIKVWDPVVRIGHWTLVAAFFTAYFTEDEFLTAHVWAGYVIAVVVSFRLIWGFVGSQHSRFADFVRSPATTIRYLVDMVHHRSRRYLGHNPAGAAMILALFVFLAITVTSGMALYGVEDGAGPLAAWVSASEEQEELWEEIHEVFANLTLLLVGLHIAGMLFSSHVHGENLVKAMMTGRKRVSSE